MDEYIGPMDSVPTEEVPLFESPADGATDEKDLQVKDRGDATESQRYCAFHLGRVSLDDPTTYHQITSWVRGPKKDSPILREYTGLVACGDCISRLRSGLSPSETNFEAALESPAEPAHEGTIFTDLSASYRVGYEDGYAGRPLDPLKYKSIIEGYYSDGYVDGQAKAELDKLREDMGETNEMA